GSRAARESAGGPSKSRRRSIFAILLTMLAAKIFSRLVLGLFVTGDAVPAGVTPGSPEHVRYVAEQVNKLLPKDVDADLRVRHVTAREHELVYDIDVLSRASWQVDAAGFVAGATRLVRAQACREAGMKVFRKHGITGTFRFNGNDHVEIASISFSPAD